MSNTQSPQTMGTLPADIGRTALNGIRVADLTQFEAGTSCTQMLAWLGAEVIKVEEPGKGEQGRRASVDIPGVDSFVFMMVNNNKRSVTANLRQEKGRQILLDLIRVSDVIVENFGPGTIERLGLSYETIKAINPRIVYAQIKGFAPDGPYGKYLAFDGVIQAAGGAMSITGEPDGMPTRSGVNLADTGAGLHCALGIVAALFQRQTTGVGQRVEVVMQEAVVNFARMAFARQATSGKPVERTGGLNPTSTAPSGFYPCKGGGPNDYCFIYTTRAGSHHWNRMLGVLGRDDLQDDPRFATPELRFEHRDIVNDMVSQWTMTRTKQQAMTELGDAGVPASAVFDTLELQNDPYLRKRGTFVTVNHPVRGEVVVPGWPVKLSDSSVTITAPPLLGADTADIYTKLLGMTPEVMEALRAEGII
ncbi:MAG TPA: CoA transferase [Devosia sp.]|nr:CoA transferase [Devosia sp.]